MSESTLRKDDRAYACYLVEGTDPGLVSQSLSMLLSKLSAADETSVGAIEEYGGGTEEGSFVGPALDACRTPPFFAPRRIIVLRDIQSLDASQMAEINGYLADPLDTTVLVLAHVGRSVPAALTKAVKACGLVINTAPAPSSRARAEWYAQHLHNSSLHLDQQATSLLQDHLGEDLARLEGTLATLEAAFDKGTTIHADDLAPLLGTAGAVAPWDLTDALDGGDSDGAIGALDRMLNGGERHPLQVIAVLHRHYGAMLRLDGAEPMDEKAAAAATGMSPFPTKKALAQSKRLGHARVARAIELLAEADVDLRGRIGWPPELVLEVLVARLAQLGRFASRNTSQRTTQAKRRA